VQLPEVHRRCTCLGNTPELIEPLPKILGILAKEVLIDALRNIGRDEVDNG
jgi:hypothetical protein